MLAEIEAEGTAGALVAMLQAGARAESDPLAAGETLEAAAGQGDLPAVYRDAAAHWAETVVTPRFPVWNSLAIKVLRI